MLRRELLKLHCTSSKALHKQCNVVILLNPFYSCSFDFSDIEVHYINTKLLLLQFLFFKHKF